MEANLWDERQMRQPKEKAEERQRKVLSEEMEANRERKVELRRGGASGPTRRGSTPATAGSLALGRSNTFNGYNRPGDWNFASWR